MDPTFTEKLFYDRVNPGLNYAVGPANGPPLLLLHGLARNWTDWKILLPDLAKRWQLFALDHRGHGYSDLSGSYSVLDYCHDTERFVRNTFQQPVTVLGHSLGAMVALWLAAECGEHVAKIILEDPPFHTMGKNITATPYQAQFAGMQHVAGSRAGKEIKAVTDDLSAVEVPTANGSKRLGELRDRASLRYSAECLMHVDPEVFTSLIAGQWLDGFDYEALWPRVRCPAVLLQGDPAAGGAFTSEDVEIARAKLPSCEHHFFAGVGHQIHRTRPEEVLALL